MTTEQLALSCLASVTGALCYIAKLLWAQNEECRTDRAALRLKVEALESARGEAVGTLKAYQRCHVDECPFRDEEQPRRITSHSSLSPHAS